MPSNAKLLHSLILKWIHNQGWQSLHDIQELAIKPILEGNNDIIISAATASGKTEAAFLPAITKILNDKEIGIRIVYISPLKALINDQYKRLDAICHSLKVNVTPWHGDISNSKKSKLFNIPDGILLITPESLESLLINHHSWCKESLKSVAFFIIDEFHAFIGDVRGYQLLSQLHRIETLVGKKIPRIAISATLSNIQLVKGWLRPNSKSDIKLIQSLNSKRGLQLQIRGYQTLVNNVNINDEPTLLSPELVYDLFKQMRGNTNLIFANSRAKTEYFATTLKNLSEKYHVPNEFFPHHGSLAKELRETLENRLKEGKLPTTAICTQTLELGIDIGDVTSVAQIQSPQSVASLRQRLGRAGRRNSDAILRLYIIEKIIPKDSPVSPWHLKLQHRLFNQTFLSTAMIELVLNRWVEPPTSEELALSTLVQQTLSTIAQYGSLKAISIWNLLCKTGPFHLVTQKIFAMLLRSLATNDLITQLDDGTLTLGLMGERLVSKYTFYGSFKTQEEYTIEFNGVKLGTVPINQPLEIGQTFLFAGKGCEVTYINPSKRIISVKEYKDKTEPLDLDSGFGLIHDGVREKMFELYTSKTVPVYLNSTAKQNFLEGQKLFKKLKLKDNYYLVGNNGIYLFPWKGDKIMYTISRLLKLHGIKSSVQSSYIIIPSTSTLQLKEVVTKILESPSPKPEELATTIKNLEYEKFDHFLTQELLWFSIGSRNFDIPGAMEFFKKMLASKEPFNRENGAAYDI